MPERNAPRLALPGIKAKLEQGTLEEMAGVQEVIKVSKPYKLVSRDIKEDNTNHPFWPGRRRPLVGLDWRLSPGRARSRAANRHLPWPSACIARGRSFFAVELTSRERLLIRFRDWARKVCGSWARFASSMG